MRKLLTILFICMWVISANAQVSMWNELSQEASSEINNDRGDSLFIPESLDANVDSLLNSWHVKYYTKRSDDCGKYRDVLSSDSVYSARLASLPRVINMTYNEQVRQCIDLYVDRRRTLVEYMLGLTDFYFPMIEKALDENGLPMELKYLAVVESALNPTALSRVGASGLWQFMLPTGKIYGLEINSLVDERRDPEKATYAACQYFKDMYDIYRDWDLVIASYNCGPGNVNKAIRRAGGKTNFWEIYEYLPRETRTYVPLFIAANYVMNYYHEHNICPVQTELPLSVDTVMISKQLHFDQVAEVLKVDKGLLKALNPQYKRDIVPGNYKSCVLQLPASSAYAFSSLSDSIYSYRTEEFFASNNSYSSANSNSSKEKIVHRVKSGESMVSIASKYGVTLSQIKKWNGLRSSKVKSGNRLTLYVDTGGYSLAENSVSESKSETKVASTASTNTSTSSPKSKKTSDSVDYRKYKVKSGDTFYSISQKYPGVSANDLMRINNMRSSKLRVGQVIKVPTV